MGFSVQLAVVRGRPSDADLERWASTALARLEVVRTPLLVAAGRSDPAAKPFTVVFLSRQDAGLEELTWLGPAPSHWQRRLPVAARPSAGGLFRRVKKAP